MKQAQYIKITALNSKFYYKDRELTILHRIDGPAIEYADGSKVWYVDGKRHRIDGPACEYASGGKVWYINGELHRIDGPAVEYANGSKYRHVDDKSLTEQKFNQRFAPEIVLTMDEIADKLGIDVSKLKIKK